MSQEDLGYQKPSQEILELADVDLAPLIYIDAERENMIMLYRNAYKSIEELSEKELRLGGLRINPKTNIDSRKSYYYNLNIRRINTDNDVPIQVANMPQNAKLANFTWSSDQKKMALTNTTSDGVELWVLDMKTAALKKLTEPTLNANLGAELKWFQDNESILVKNFFHEP